MRSYGIPFSIIFHPLFFLRLSFQRPTEAPKKSAFLEEDEVGDDWLDDDLANLPVRPTKRRCEQFVGQQLRNLDKSASTSTIKPSTST